MSLPPRPALPRRFERPSALAFVVWVLALALIVSALGASGLSLERFARGLPSLERILRQMFPPEIERLDAILATLWQTFLMAVAGATLGVVLSLPLAVLAARNLTPHWTVAFLARGLVAFFRTVPDLVWALLFVIAVGLGPAAGTLAIMVDTIGFAARFFAEALEEADRGPGEALTAAGAGRLSVIGAGVIPLAVPSFVATSLYCLEKATRSSVVLGLVGAGGIGIELKVAMDLFDYPTAATIILAIFALVVLVEQASSRLRERII